MPSLDSIPRVTPRGVAAIGVIGISAWLAHLHGPRSLNALVIPVLVAVGAAAITVTATREPTVTRDSIEPGFIGETRDVGIEFAVDTPVTARMSDAVGNGVTEFETTPDASVTDGDRFAYAVRLDRRGRHEVGPISVEVADVFGLAKRRFTLDESASVTVYPTVYRLRDDVQRRIVSEAASHERDGLHERSGFDHLRTYERGDDLRAVNWKATAKRADDELIVEEYRTEAGVPAVDVVGESADGCADEMASAVASVVGAVLGERPVGVTIPGDSIPHDDGAGHWYEVLGRLAVVDAGRVSAADRRDADVLVRSDADGTTVVVDGEELPFDGICGEPIYGGGDDESSDRSKEVERADERSRGVIA